MPLYKTSCQLKRFIHNKQPKKATNCLENEEKGILTDLSRIMLNEEQDMDGIFLTKNPDHRIGMNLEQ